MTSMVPLAAGRCPSGGCSPYSPLSRECVTLLRTHDSAAVLDPQQVTDLRQPLSLARRRVSIARRHFGLARRGLCLVLRVGIGKAAEQLVHRDNDKEVN